MGRELQSLRQLASGDAVREPAGVMALIIGLLVVQIITVWALGIKPRHRSLEELKGDEAAPALVKQVT